MELFARAECDRQAAQERLRKRQMRIIQVRQQTQNFMSKSRSQFEQEKSRQMDAFLDEMRAEVEADIVQQIEDLTIAHDLALEEIGAAHRAAANNGNEDELAELKLKKRLRGDAMAQKRFREALRRERGQSPLPSSTSSAKTFKTKSMSNANTNASLPAKRNFEKEIVLGRPSTSNSILGQSESSTTSRNSSIRVISPNESEPAPKSSRPGSGGVKGQGQGHISSRGKVPSARVKTEPSKSSGRVKPKVDMASNKPQGSESSSPGSGGVKGQGQMLSRAKVSTAKAIAGPTKKTGQGKSKVDLTSNKPQESGPQSSRSGSDGVRGQGRMSSRAKVPMARTKSGQVKSKAEMTSNEPKGSGSESSRPGSGGVKGQGQMSSRAKVPTAIPRAGPTKSSGQVKPKVDMTSNKTQGSGSAAPKSSSPGSDGVKVQGQMSSRDKVPTTKANAEPSKVEMTSNELQGSGLAPSKTKKLGATRTKAADFDERLPRDSSGQSSDLDDTLETWSSTSSIEVPELSFDSISSVERLDNDLEGHSAPSTPTKTESQRNVEVSLGSKTSTKSKGSSLNESRPLTSTSSKKERTQSSGQQQQKQKSSSRGGHDSGRVQTVPAHRSKVSSGSKGEGQGSSSSFRTLEGQGSSGGGTSTEVFPKLDDFPSSPKNSKTSGPGRVTSKISGKEKNKAPAQAQSSASKTLAPTKRNLQKEAVSKIDVIPVQSISSLGKSESATTSKNLSAEVISVLPTGLDPASNSSRLGSGGVKVQGQKSSSSRAKVGPTTKAKAEPSKSSGQKVDMSSNKPQGSGSALSPSKTKKPPKLGEPGTKVANFDEGLPRDSSGQSSELNDTLETWSSSVEVPELSFDSISSIERLNSDVELESPGHSAPSTPTKTESQGSSGSKTKSKGSSLNESRPLTSTPSKKERKTLSSEKHKSTTSRQSTDSPSPSGSGRVQTASAHASKVSSGSKSKSQGSSSSLRTPEGQGSSGGTSAEVFPKVAWHNYFPSSPKGSKTSGPGRVPSKISGKEKTKNNAKSPAHAQSQAPAQSSASKTPTRRNLQKQAVSKIDVVLPAPSISSLEQSESAIAIVSPSNPVSNTPSDMVNESASTSAHTSQESRGAGQKHPGCVDKPKWGLMCQDGGGASENSSSVTSGDILKQFIQRLLAMRPGSVDALSSGSGSPSSTSLIRISSSILGIRTNTEAEATATSIEESSNNVLTLSSDRSRMTTASTATTASSGSGSKRKNHSGNSSSKNSRNISTTSEKSTISEKSDIGSTMTTSTPKSGSSRSSKNKSKMSGKSKTSESSASASSSGTRSTLDHISITLLDKSGTTGSEGSRSTGTTTASSTLLDDSLDLTATTTSSQESLTRRLTKLCQDQSCLEDEDDGAEDEDEA